MASKTPRPLTRRRILAAGSGFIAGAGFALPRIARAALPIPDGNNLGFAVMRKGSQIGTHILTFAPSDDGLVVKVGVDLMVKFGPIVLFRYTHRATETWSGEQVVSIASETDDNGKKLTVKGALTADGFSVEATKLPPYVAPPSALPATHWNRRMLDGPFINTQDGRLMRPTITPLGPSQIPTAGGTDITAEHFSMTGDAVLDTWYDSTWAGISFKGGDGSLIQYCRM